MNIGNERYFFDLMDLLVQWSRHENHEPFDLNSISVCKNYNQSSEFVTTLLVIGYVGDSDRDIEEFFSCAKHTPGDQNCINTMSQWFEFGNPFGGGYAFYQSCCTLSPQEIFAAMDYLKSECNRRYPGVSIDFQKPMDKSSGAKTQGGCYIATAVYGSYDCPEVWTLRRFRDFKLQKTYGGRLFVKAYYAISPQIVKRFGETSWFNHFWKKRLDKMVKRLRRKGFKNTPYEDKF